MPRADYKQCRNCGRFSKDVGLLSRSRLCAACGPAVLEDVCMQLVDHRGPKFQKWRRGMAASVGVELHDSFPSSP